MTTESIYDPAVVEDFLRSAESTIRREQIKYVMQSVEMVRSKVATLTLAEAHVALQEEYATWNRGAVIRRLKQRITARSAELVAEYIQSQEEE